MRHRHAEAVSEAKRIAGKGGLWTRVCTRWDAIDPYLFLANARLDASQNALCMLSCLPSTDHFYWWWAFGIANVPLYIPCNACTSFCSRDYYCTWRSRSARREDTEGCTDSPACFESAAAHATNRLQNTGAAEWVYNSACNERKIQCFAVEQLQLIQPLTNLPDLDIASPRFPPEIPSTLSRIWSLWMA